MEDNFDGMIFHSCKKAPRGTKIHLNYGKSCPFCNEILGPDLRKAMAEKLNPLDKGYDIRLESNQVPSALAGDLYHMNRFEPTLTDQGRQMFEQAHGNSSMSMGVGRNGSPTFYSLLERMANVHDSKSHDYASNVDPFGNYHFAGKLSKLFDNPDDSGFLGRIGEKIYRLANIENSGKEVKNETIEDTEIDILTITNLWMADRIDRRKKAEGEKIEAFAKGTPSDGSIVKQNLIQVNEDRIECIKCGRKYRNNNEYIHHAIDMHSALYNHAQKYLKFNDVMELLV